MEPEEKPAEKTEKRECVLKSKIGIGIICTFVGITVGAVAAQAQFAPPPPPNMNMSMDGSFTARDRACINEIRDCARATYEKLFPQVNDGTRILIPRRGYD